MDAILNILRSLAGALVRQWPDLVGTFYGVLLGGLATLGIVRWQIGEERKARERMDKEFLALLVEHVNREIAKNLRTLRDLAAAFGQAEVPRLEMWDWAVTIAGSFASQAYDDLYRTGLQRYLPPDFEEEIRTANTIVFDVRHRVRQARARHIFNAAYRQDAGALNEALLAEVRDLLPMWLKGLEHADRAVAPQRLPWIAVPLARKVRVRRKGVVGGGLRKLASLRRGIRR
jgi:hypothetical protein